MRAMPRSAATVRERLEDAILRGDLRPGQRLDEATLAAAHGVSRTPLREAFQHLAAAGLIAIRPHRGAFVARFGADELVALFEVMAELEAACARLAARRLTAAEGAALSEAHTACMAAARESPDAYFYANEAFHDALYRAAGNPFLAEEARRFHRRLRPYRRLQLRAGRRVQDSLGEHGAILAAVLAGDGEAAAAAARGHVAIQGERFGDFLASLAHLDTAAE